MNVNRSSQHQAIVLRLRSFGESHAMVDLLSREEGLVPAVAWGLKSRRSTLRGKVVPFAQGTVWLYRDPRQERAKITDIEVQRYATELQHDLTSYYHASLWAEVIWRTWASADAEGEVWAIFSRGLTLLDAADVDPALRAARARQLGLGLLWRYLALMGLQPDLDRCAASERRLRPDEPRFYQGGAGGLVAAEWASPVALALPPRGVAFLRAAVEREPEILTARMLDPETLGAVRAVVLAAVQDAAEQPLNTLAVAGGML